MKGVFLLCFSLWFLSNLGYLMYESLLPSGNCERWKTEVPYKVSNRLRADAVKFRKQTAGTEVGIYPVSNLGVSAFRALFGVSYSVCVLPTRTNTACGQ